MDFSDIKHELKALHKNKTNFSGSSPPEIFVGRHDYPNIYSGILSPIKYGNTESFSSPERWFEKQLEIKEILEYRKQLIYSRFKTRVKNARFESNLQNALNQVSMAKKSVNAEFFLSKPPKFKIIKENSVPIIGNPAPLKKVRLEDNPKIHKKVDYIVSDNKMKASQSIQDLYKNKIETSNIIKILSAGLLGLQSQRKLVPTRWSITAVDDTLSKEHLKQIRNFKEINEIELFYGEYLGNHYEIILLPDKWSFEVIEISEKSQESWHDYELFFPRKTYASNVVGGYYAVRLGITEYLLRKQRQATTIVFREVRKEYKAPLGVGILRELTRNIFNKQGKKFPTIDEALNEIDQRIKLNISEFRNQSILLNEFGKQKRLSEWF
jgi:DNA repair protein NreA